MTSPPADRARQDLSRERVLRIADILEQHAIGDHIPTRAMPQREAAAMLRGLLQVLAESLGIPLDGLDLSVSRGVRVTPEPAGERGGEQAIERLADELWAIECEAFHREDGGGMPAFSEYEDAQGCDDCRAVLREDWNTELLDYMRARARRLFAVLATGSDRPRIVCLCGSTRFYRAFQEANYRETMAGRVVLSVAFYPHVQDEAHGGDVGVSDPQKLTLDALHLRKIDLADEVLVLNVGGYIGDSTCNEIAYATRTGKPVRYLEPLATPSAGSRDDE